MTSKVTVQAKGMPANELVKLMQRIGPIQNATIQAQFNPQAMLEQMFVRYNSRLLELSSKMRKLVEFDPKPYENNDKYLRLLSKPEANEVELGDRVKICMKKRQFKQLRVGSWNESITQDLGAVGTVISLWEDGEREAVVHYYKSGKSWVISRRCLMICNDGTDKLPPTTDGRLTVGDVVMVPYEKSVVRDMQAGRGGNPDEIIMLNPFLDKVLAFDNRGNVFVSYDDNHSVLINSSLLTVRPSWQPSATLVTEEMKTVTALFPLESFVVLREVKALFENQEWNYNLTELIGSNDLRVRFHCRNGLIGVSKGLGSNKTIYLLNKSLIMRKQKPSSRRMKGIDQKKTKSFALMNNQEVYLITDGVKQLLSEMRISPDFIMVLLQPGKLLGYQAPKVVVVEINKQSFMMPAAIVRQANNNVLLKAFHQQARTTLKLKVGDDVILDIGPFSLAAQRFEETAHHTTLVPSVLTKAVILAFDDNTDEAFLRFRDGSMYAVPTEFVIARNRFLENAVQVPASVDQQFVPLRYTSEEMDLLLTIRQRFEHIAKGNCDISFSRQSDEQLQIVVYLPQPNYPADLHKVSGCLTDEKSGTEAVRRGDVLEVARGKTKVIVRQTLDEASLLELQISNEEPGDKTGINDSLLLPVPNVDSLVDDDADDDTSSQAPTDEADHSHDDASSVTEEELQPSEAQSPPGRVSDEPVTRRNTASSALGAVRYEKDRNEIVISCDAFSEQEARRDARPAVGRQNSIYREVPESQKETFNTNNYFSNCIITNSNIAASAPVEQTIVHPVDRDA